MFKIFYLFLTVFIVNSSGINSIPIDEDAVCKKYDSADNADNFYISECDVVKIELTEGTDLSKRDELQLTIKKQTGENISLNLKHNKNFLVDENTPVWFGRNTFTGWGDISYEKSSIKMVTTAFDKFATFQDYNKKTAMILFSNGSDWIMEGFFGNYLLKHDSDDIYVLFTVNFITDGVASSEKLDRKCERIVQKLPINLNSSIENIYPEIMVALDWNSVKNKTSTEVIKSILIYYNAVDMLFSQFQSPEIQLSIAGIIIPTDSQSSPYFGVRKGRFNYTYASYVPIHGYLTAHMKKYSDKFSMRNYDIVMGMSSVQFCDADEFCNYYGVSHQSENCESVDEDYYSPITAAVRHPNFQGHYPLMAKEIAHILGSQYTAPWKPSDCGNIMKGFTNFIDPLRRTLKWPQYAVDEISKNFRDNGRYSLCMQNEPEMVKKTVTTASPVTTMASPVTTAASPVIAEASSATTVASPVTTKASPVTAAASPVTAAASPVTKTAFPVTPTAASVTITASPVTTMTSPAIPEITSKNCLDQIESIQIKIPSTTDADTSSRSTPESYPTIIVVKRKSNDLNKLQRSRRKVSKVFDRLFNRFYHYVCDSLDFNQ